MTIADKSDGIDVDDAKQLAAVFKKEKPDIVFHLAGVINLRLPVTDPLFIKDLGFMQRTYTILEACKTYGVKKIIFISSGAVYGKADVIPTPESCVGRPDSLYALASLMVEKYIENFYKDSSLQYAIARLSNVYGERQWKSGIVPAIVTQILAEQPPIIYGDGNQTRDFIYIDDVVDALVKLAEKVSNSTYNIASGKEISLNTLFSLVKKISVSSMVPIHKEAKSGESQRSALDIQKIKKDIGWAPQVSLEIGLRQAVNFYAKEKN